jgi:surface polysaccharide O-acyltransferase-like enzyme
VLSLGWAAVRDQHPTARRALHWCSSAAFGVYLVHPLVLDGVLGLGLHGPEPRLVPQPAASVVAWVLTLAGSVVLVAGLRRTPLSLPLTGRSRPSRPQPAVSRPDLVETS